MNSHIDCELAVIKHEEDPLLVTEIKTESQDSKSNEAKTEAENCDINKDTQPVPHVLTTNRTVSEFSDSTFTMNSHIDCELAVIKHEEDPLLVTEIKTESQDSKSNEAKTEAENCDINKDTQPVPHVLTTNRTVSEDTTCKMKTEAEEFDNFVEHIDIKHENEYNSELVVFAKPTLEVQERQGRLDKLLREYEKKSQDEQENTEEETNIAPVVHNPFDNIYGTDLQKLTSGVHVNDYTREKIDKCRKMCHTNEKPFKCYICSKQYARKSNLTVHINSHTKEKPFKCNICGKSFSDNYLFTRHTRIHSNEKPLACNFCSKSFSKKFNLIIHIRTHTNEKPFRCNICNKSFYDKSTLRKHTRIHTNEKPFKCNICSKSFSRKSHVTTHTRIHTNEKPFKCNFCNKKFPDKFAITKHIRTYTNEKPFKCNFCSKSFSQKYNLNRHTLTHINEKPFMCNICGKSFTRKADLAIHIRSHAGENNI